MSTPLRVIFDRSAFHGEYFEILFRSRLLDVTQNKKLIVLHTPIFLEETLGMYAKERNRDTLRKQLPFILDICSGGWFRNREEIWHDEIVRNRRIHAQWLRPEKERTWVEREIRSATASGDQWPDFWVSQTARDDAAGKKAIQRKILRKVREDVSVAMKGKKGVYRNIFFRDYERQNFDYFGCMLLQSFLRTHLHADRTWMWSRYKSRYPHFTGFVRGFIYDVFYAAVEHNAPLDANAQADFEQLVYLQNADIVVSAEQGVFPAAFETLWKSHRKVLFTPERFAHFVRLL